MLIMNNRYGLCLKGKIVQIINNIVILLPNSSLISTWVLYKNETAIIDAPNKFVLGHEINYYKRNNVYS